MKASKKKISKNRVWKYIFTFFIVIFLFVVLLVMEKSLPNYRQKNNILKSESYYNDYLKQNFQNLNSVIDKHTTIDLYSDITSLSIIYLENNHRPFSEFIEMNHDKYAVYKVLRKDGFKSFEKNADYARYWHGNLSVLKVLLSFFSMKTIYIIYFIILLITFFILIIELLKKSKVLATAYAIVSILVNTFFVSNCDALFYVFLISMIVTIILIKMMNKNSKNIDLLFLITGMITCFFDLLSCETITLTIPLFVFVYLKWQEEKKLRFKELFLYILLWGVGYIGTFIMKWVITVFYYHGHFMDKIFVPMTKRIVYENSSIIKIFYTSIKDVLHYIYPFNNNILKITLLILGIISYIILLFNHNNRKYLIMLLIIGVIPFIRYLVLTSHSDYHNYFTYRAFIPFIMLLIISIINFIQIAYQKIKT